MAPKVSVIVPVYRVEPYLYRCVDSLRGQTLEDIQIILVDDGSPDRCGEMCDRFAAQDERITVLHKENGGLASARNVGLETALGEYIGFVDSDDWVAEDMFRLLYEAAARNDADIAICDYMTVADSPENCSVVSGAGKDLSVEGLLLSGFKPVACNKLFKNDKKFRFYEHLKFAEDRPMVVSLLTRSRRIAYVPKPLYFYYQREGSIADTYSRRASYLYDIESLRLTLRDADPRYQKQTIKYCVDIVMWTLANRTRNTCKADMIEFLQEISGMLVRNRYLNANKELADYIARETIPPTLVLSAFEKSGALTETQKICRASWTSYAPNAELVTLDADNCGIDTAPPCVREAYSRGEFGFAGDYFRLKYVYENGGIAISDGIKMELPIGGLRTEKTFFGFLNLEEINSGIFGSIPQTEVLRDVLLTYEEDSLLNEGSVWPLSERIRAVLKQYGLEIVGNGGTKRIKNGICVFGCECLSQNMQTSFGITHLYGELDMEAEQAGAVLVDRAVAAARMGRAGAASGNAAALQHKVRLLEMEVDRLKNSRSWRMTRILRRIRNFFRKVKYSKEEVW